MRSFLVVEDNKGLRDLYEMLIKRKYGNVHVDKAFDGLNALKKIQEIEYTVIVIDLDIPVINGLQLYGKIKDISPSQLERTVFVTGHISSPYLNKLASTRRPYLVKPFGSADFYSRIDPIIDFVESRFYEEHARQCERRSIRVKAAGKCMLEPLRPASLFFKCNSCHVKDFSEGGLAVIYSGREISPGTDVCVTISEFDIIKKKAKVVWSKFEAEHAESGVRWT